MVHDRHLTEEFITARVGNQRLEVDLAFSSMARPPRSPHPSPLPVRGVGEPGLAGGPGALSDRLSELGAGGSIKGNRFHF